MTYHTDLWQCGIVKAPIGRFLQPLSAHRPEVTWLPPPLADFCFTADPFGIWHDDYLFIFAEAYDYRNKLGTIKGFAYSRDLIFLEEFEALREPWHLSYPFLLRDGAEIYMVPESHQANGLFLYRAKRFPYEWERIATLIADQPVIDASIIQHEGRWWMFYALAGEDKRAMKELHIAYTDILTGPWHPHAHNPVRTDIASSRPGGTPFVAEGVLYLPVQDGTHSYGGALALLKIEKLTPDHFTASIAQTHIAQGWHPNYTEGFHTLSTCGDLTLIDVKRVDTSSRRFWINLVRRVRRLTGRR